MNSPPLSRGDFLLVQFTRRDSDDYPYPTGNPTRVGAPRTVAPIHSRIPCAHGLATAEAVQVTTTPLPRGFFAFVLHECICLLPHPSRSLRSAAPSAGPLQQVGASDSPPRSRGAFSRLSFVHTCMSRATARPSNRLAVARPWVKPQAGVRKERTVLRDGTVRVLRVETDTHGVIRRRVVHLVPCAKHGG